MSQWLFELKLIPQLVSQLAPSNPTDTLLNASQALVDIVGKAGSSSSQSFLIEHLQSPSVLNQLLDYALDPVSRHLHSLLYSISPYGWSFMMMYSFYSIASMKII